MGIVYESSGMRIVVYTNDHNPPHCHVIHNDWWVKLNIQNGFSVVDYGGKKLPPFKEVISIAKELRYEIGRTWRDYHGN